MVISVWIFFTQIFGPAWNDRKIFPMFRGEGKLRRKIRDANSRIRMANLKAEAAESDVKASKVELESEKEIDDNYESLDKIKADDDNDSESESTSED